jgi:pimeloyl-ACP methyl ester carboxylesterase
VPASASGASPRRRARNAWSRFRAAIAAVSRDAIERFASPRSSNGDAHVALVGEADRDPDLRALGAIARRRRGLHWTDEDAEARLKSARVPLLAVVGDQDNVSRRGASRKPFQTRNLSSCQVRTT